MDHVSYFKDFFESIPDCTKIVLLLFSITNDVDLLPECGFSRNDINCLCLEIKTTLMEQNKEYLEYNKNEEDSILEKVSNK